MKLHNVFLLISLFVVGSISAYTATIINKTDGQIVAHIEYVVCGPDDVIIEAGQSRDVAMKGCCANYITARATSGKAKGQSNNIKPPIYGMPAMTCASMNVEISNSLSGGIIMQAAIK